MASAVAGIAVLLVILISVLYFISISENIMASIEKIAARTGGAGGLHAERIDVYSGRIEITARASGGTVYIDRYYVRSSSGAIYTGSLSYVIPAGSSTKIIIPGSFNPSAEYYIALIGSEIYSFNYPIQEAADQAWSRRIIDSLIWNRTVVSADVEAVYAADYVDVYVESATTLKGSAVAGSVQDLSNIDLQTLDLTSEPTSSSIYIYYPSTATAVSGSIESGSVADLQASDDIYLVLKPDIEVYAPAVYLYYPENITFITSTYYKLRIQDPGTASPVSFSGSASLPSFSTVCFQTESWAYPLQPYAGRTIPAGTWTVYYNAWYSSSGFLLDAYAIVDIAVVDTAGNKNYIATGFARASLSTTAGSIVFASDNFPGYTVSPQDRYLVVEPFLCFRTFFSVTVTAYFVVNTTNTRIEAPQTFAYIYSATVDLSGSSNTASDWLSLKVDLEASASVGGVSGYVSLFNYQAGSFQTAPPGYTAISFSTTDTVYSIAVQDQDAPENFRDPSTGGFTIRIYASRQVDWNEDFRLYIDLASFKPETVDRYEVYVRFYTSSVPSGNVVSVAVNASLSINVVPNTLSIELYSFQKSAADTIYSLDNATSVSIFAEVHSPEYVSQNGEVVSYLSIVHASEDAKPFSASIDLYRFRVAIANATALVIATANSYGNITIYSVASGSEKVVQVGAGVGYLSAASNGTGIYLAFSGSSSLYFISSLSGSISAVAQLPVAPQLPILVFVAASGELLYIPDAVSPTAYIYSQASGTWVQATLGIAEPVDVCIYGGGVIVCVSQGSIHVVDPATYSVSASYRSIEFSKAIGIGFDPLTSLFYILYQSSAIYVFNTSSGELTLYGYAPRDVASFYQNMHLDVLEVDPVGIYIVKPLSKILYMRNLQLS